MSRMLLLLLGIAAVLAVTALWHGPLGAGERFAAKLETAARAELVRQEMEMVTARLQRQPLSRTLILSGPADDFQHRELVRIMGEVPGVGSVRWANPPAPSAEVR